MVILLDCLVGTRIIGSITEEEEEDGEEEICGDKAGDNASEEGRCREVE